ncbi:MAG: DUF4363 family protein [Clostridia bacterium]|nr:DUF4363 family protein [Clostridia bacterium]
MKQLVIAVALVLLMVVGSLIWEQHVQTNTEKLTQLLDRAGTEVMQNRPATPLLQAYETAWQGLKKHWAMLIDHEYLLKAEELLIRIKMYEQTNKRDEALNGMAELTLLLNEMVQGYKLTLSNLL